MVSTATGWPRVCILWRGGVSCPLCAAWHSCDAAHWSKYHCYKQALLRYDLRCLKVTLNPNKNSCVLIVDGPTWKWKDYYAIHLTWKVKEILWHRFLVCLEFLSWVSLLEIWKFNKRVISAFVLFSWNHRYGIIYVDEPVMYSFIPIADLLYRSWTLSIFHLFEQSE